MPLYRMTDEEFEELEETSFGAEGIYERYDLQRMLRDQADVLEEGLFILSEEYGDWVESSRRIDLLGLDAKGRLVVVELKREDQDSLMDLQAVRYAAMVANMTSEQALIAHQSYLQARGIEGDAESRIRDHLKSYEEEVSISTHNPRIILASANFSTELTTSVLWLNQVGLDITCVRLQPYNMDGSIFVERTQILPMPESADYMVRLRDRERETESQRRVHISAGGDDFAESLNGARAEFVDKLQRLYQFALSLEEEGIASLSTSIGSNRAFLSPNPPKDTDGRREDSERVVRELQGRWPGLHWGRWEVGGRSSVAAQGPYGRLRELRYAGWRENTQQGTLADRGGASLRGRWVSCRLTVRPGVEWLAAGPRRE